MSIIVHLGDYAFQSLLISSIETFPSEYLRAGTEAAKPRKGKRISKHEGESFGLLFGQRMMKKEGDLVFNVTLAVPMQAAMHQNDMVTFSPPHFRRIREVTESFPYLEFLGTFHSHPYPKDDYNGKPTSEFSRGDENSALHIAKDYGDELLEVILGITALDRHSYRQAKSEGETIQSYCGRFKYSLSAFCTLGAANEDEDEEDEESDVGLESDEVEWEEDGDEDEDEDDFECCLMSVDRLICPLAAHGGEMFGRVEL